MVEVVEESGGGGWWARAPMDAKICVLELSGLLFYTGAWLCTVVTTMMSTWLTLSTELLPTESYQLGLWETCVVQGNGGVTECRPYDSLLGLPPEIKLARVLMCAAVAAGSLGLFLAIPGMYVVNGCDVRLEDLKVKRVLKGVGGVLSLAAGTLGLVPASYVAHLTVVRFFDRALPALVPRWELGDALFCGWTATILHLIAGGLLLSSCVCAQQDNCGVAVRIPLVGGHHTHPLRPGPVRSQRSRSEYV